MLIIDSRAISECVNKLHKNVIKDIERLFKDLNINPKEYLSKYSDVNNHSRKCYKLTKSLSDIIIARYSNLYCQAILQTTKFNNSEEYCDYIGDITRSAKRTSGHVYIISTDGRVKIGRSNNPRRRVRSIVAIAGITEHTFFISEALIDCHVIEKQLHEILKDCRISGEWFAIPFKTAMRKLNGLVYDTRNGLP